ncbi:tetratricopeptide repeat protein [Streptomyces sp. NPDC002680]|uniref:tetratricopeptide repeat protein n=1 Tax=Streptomyces sp. NPDC002680 TaxID=3364659 RepID=UPI0036B5C2A3
MEFKRNSFHDTMIGLSCSPTDYPADIFSQACVESFNSCNWFHFGYAFTQVFEPAVLYEVALLEGTRLAPLAILEDRRTDALVRLGAMLDQASEHTVVELLNLASALISISRFELVRNVLAILSERQTTSREDFEIGWLKFVVSNRCEGGSSSPAAFERMRAAVITREVPASRVLDACTQAVVWYVKRRELPTADFERWRELGTSLSKMSGRVEPGALSSWYRGVAMLPAAIGDAAATRHYMNRAREAADACTGGESRAADLNAIKTYYESAVKEYLYVQRDADAAEEAGRALIALDPVWSVSYGELAEVYLQSKRVEHAAQLYEQAAAAGPPYVAHHLLKAATCRERCDDLPGAMALYEKLAGFAPHSRQVMSKGLNLARRLAHPSATIFERGLLEIESHAAD